MLSLLRLVSPTLPVGGYSYSRGLEWAVESGEVADLATAEAWIGASLGRGIARADAALLPHFHAAFAREDDAEVRRLGAVLLALRESRELIDEERNMGEALGRLLVDLGHPRAAPLLRTPACSFCAMFALAALEWGIQPDDAVAGYLWMMAESQVNAAVRLVPLGQTDAQRALRRLAGQIPQWQQLACALPEQDWGGFLPGLAAASAHHETQYTRLFRS